MLYALMVTRGGGASGSYSCGLVEGGGYVGLEESSCAIILSVLTHL